MQLKAVMKDHPALRANGERTVYGYFDEGDIPLLAKAYPRIGEHVIERIANAINAPRLLEVTTILEVVHRYLERSFSQIRGLGINAVANPLSVLFWNTDFKRVQRIKTDETELMHGAAEKLALRTDGVAKINQILADSFGVQLAFACSCCVLVGKTADLPGLLGSEYYRLRERKGRLFDSDVLCTSGDLLSGGSVTDLPERILRASADFHEAEVDSYVRFAQVNERVVATNVVSRHPPVDTKLIEFFMGSTLLDA